MMRWAILCSIVLGVCSILSAAGPSPYVLDAQATSRPDGKISVVAVIRSTSPEGRIVRAPHVEIWKGQGATMEQTTSTTQPSPAILSSTKIEVISMTGEDNVVVIARIAKDGQTIWADAQKVPISAR